MLKALKLTKKFHEINLIADNSALPETLAEYKICCLEDAKELYLLHLLLDKCSRPSTKTIIFLNSKDRLKSLNAKLQFFNVNCLILSSGLNQRQRNECVSKFNTKSVDANSNILITTDLCARGFDFENIEFVIHFDIPRTKEVIQLKHFAEMQPG